METIFMNHDVRDPQFSVIFHTLFVSHFYIVSILWNASFLSWYVSLIVATHNNARFLIN